MFQIGSASNQIVIERLIALVRDSDDAIIGKKLDGTITDWNPAAERLFGYLAEEVLGKSIAILAPPDMPDEIPFILERLRHGRRVDHFHTHRRRKDGSIIEVSLTISPIRDQDGTIIGASKISRDISQLKETARLKAVLDDNNRLLKELSHRVGNNLAIVMGVLRSEIRKAAPEHQEALEVTLQRVFELAAEHEERLRQASKVLDPSTGRVVGLPDDFR
jgi:PAS domain S-box-containing protein